jgi:hypothetical protein
MLIQSISPWSVAPFTAAGSYRELEETPHAPDVGTAERLHKLETWVPTEVVGAYIAAFALLNPSTSALRWTLLGIGFVLTLFLTLYQWVKERQKAASASNAPGPGTLAARSLLFGAAFVIYVAALPNNAFLSFDWFTLPIGGVAAIFAVLVIPKVADLLHIDPPGKSAA